MKKLLIVLSCFILSACATVAENIVFDNIQYREFVELKVLTDSAIPNCSQPSKIVAYSRVANEKAKILVAYTNYRSATHKLSNATTQLASMINDLEHRYADAKNPPSSTYCTLKLTNIGEGTSTILYTLGRME